MTTPILEATPPVGAGKARAAGRPTTRGIARWQLAAPISLIAMALPAVGASGVGVFWSLLFMTALVAVTMAPAIDEHVSAVRREERLTWIAWLPVAFIILVFAGMSVSTIGALAAPQMLSSRVGALVAWGLMVAATFAIVAKRGGRIAVVGVDAGAVSVGAIIAACGIAVVTIQPLELWSQIPSGGTDFNRHIVMIRGLVEDGGLSYAQNSYPRGLHALVAMDWLASGGMTFADAFRSMSGTLWLMVSLMAMALAVVVFRACRRLGISGRLFLLVAGVLLLMTFGQSLWVTTMVRMGFFTSVLAGLVLTAVLSAAMDKGGRWFGTPWSIGFIATAGAVLAQGWTLIVPAMAVLGFVGCVIAFRDVRQQGWTWRAWWATIVLVAISVAVSIPAVRALATERSGADGLRDSLATPGGSGMEAPQAWWGVALVLFAIAVTALWRAGARRLTFMSVLMLSVGGITVALVARAGEGALGGLNYYATKSLWTYSVIVLPLGVVGAIWLAGIATIMIATMTPGIWRSAAVAGACGLLIMLSAAVAGRISGTPSKVYEAAAGRIGTIAIAIPVVSYLESMGMDNADGEAMPDVVVWGIMPNSTLPDMAAGAPGMYDWLARESTSWLALTNYSGSPMTHAQMTRNTAAACDFLRARPDAVRITGPNPAAGAPWLLESGCPVDVVKPEQWMSIPIDDAWFEGTYLTLRPFVYPTYAEFQQFLTEKSKSLPNGASGNGR